MIMDNNIFLLNSKNIEYKNNKEEEEDDGDLILTGIASTSREASLYGEVMTEEALQEMCEQAQGLPILEGHKGDSFDTVLGVILDAYILEDDLHIDFKVLKNHQARIRELLNNDVPVGLSIGAQARIDEATNKVTSITLIEVSLTPVPANRVAHNTVHVKNNYYTGTCLHGICNAMIKDKIKYNDNLEVNNMSENKELNEEIQPNVEEKPPAKPEEKEKEDEVVDEPLTIEKVKELLDERFNEEREGLIDTIVEEVLTKLNKTDVIEAEPVKESAPVLDEDKIVESLTEKLLNSLGEKRTVTDTKTEAVLKNEAITEEPVENKPFTSEEAAKLIIEDMNKKDPLARAINKIITE